MAGRHESEIALETANLAGFRPPIIIVHEGEHADQIIKEMEARGEIPPAADFPKGRIRVIVHRIISPPTGERNWERYHTERYRAAACELLARPKSSKGPNETGA